MNTLQNCEKPSLVSRRISFHVVTRLLLVVMLGGLILVSVGCGGSSSSHATQSDPTMAGNWQFTLASPASSSQNPFTGGLQGGFLLQQNGNVSGQATYSITLPNAAAPCNSGTASVTGTVSGQSVNLTATIGSLDQNGNSITQTFTLAAGQLSTDGSTIQGGTYTLSPDGFYIDPVTNQPASCGVSQTSQSNLAWSASSIPSVTGAFQGFFHSTGGTKAAGQVFAVSGSLTQGQNIGASSATVTGALTFTGYPCLTSANLTGQISGSSVVLQIFNGSGGADVGQIGGVNTGSGTATYPVTYDNTTQGYVLHNAANSIAYALNTSGCPGTGLNSVTSGDVGNICLAFANATTGVVGTACTEPILLSPATLSFPAQILAAPSRAQQLVTLTNNDTSGAPLSGLTISLFEKDSDLFYQNGGGDFNGFPHFSEQDTCASSPGMPFDLSPQQSCTITISFAPQQSCPWLPTGSGGQAPVTCPDLYNPNAPPKASLSATLTVSVPTTGSSSGQAPPDGDGTFSIPISGAGLSALAPAVGELDFGAEDVGESSQPQTVTFTNQSTNPVQILSAASGFGQLCNDNTARIPYTLSRPPVAGVVPGLVMALATGISPNNAITPPSISYYCDYDPATNLGNMQITADTCSGATIAPNASCNVQVTFSPQPNQYNLAIGLDYFLELNTLQCDLNDAPPIPPPSASNPCEIDSGRFPVEITANQPGPIRMAPSAGLNFGPWAKGVTSNPLSVTLTNDQADSTTVSITGKALTGTDYLETDNCPAILNAGSSCTLKFTLTPSVTGLDTGSLTIGYNTSNSSGSVFGLTQLIHLRGIGCTQVTQTGACAIQAQTSSRRF